MNDMNLLYGAMIMLLKLDLTHSKGLYIPHCQMWNDRVSFKPPVYWANFSRPYVFTQQIFREIYK